MKKLVLFAVLAVLGAQTAKAEVVDVSTIKCSDLIAMTNRYRNIFQKLFDRSLTKKMINHTHIPLMAFHVKERGSYFI